MTTDLAFTVFRLGFLALMWVLVFAVVATLRRDIYGTVVTPRGTGRATSKEEKKKRTKKERQAALSRQPTKLAVTGGPLTGTLIPLGTAAISIGRAPSATLVLDDPYVSSRHAELRQVDGEWVIVDLGSTNGTYVDQERIYEQQVLSPHNPVRIGQTTFELVN